MPEVGKTMTVFGVACDGDGNDRRVISNANAPFD